MKKLDHFTAEILIKRTIAIFLVVISIAANSQTKGIPTLIMQGFGTKHDANGQAEQVANILKATGSYEIVHFRPGAALDFETFTLSFSDYQLIVMTGPDQNWPEKLKKAFQSYLSEGGNLMVLHQGVISHQDWDEFHKMIGLGWYKWDAGQHLFWSDQENKWIATPLYHGVGAGHGKQHEFSVTNRNPEHPIMKGMPLNWLHAKDEFYHGLRGPAMNVELLASAFSDKATWGSGDHEPVAWTVTYGKGRVFVTVMGHLFIKQYAEVVPGINSFENENRAVECVGFQTLVARGAEWAATGKVTIPIPKEFPSETKAFSTDTKLVNWKK